MKYFTWITSLSHHNSFWDGRYYCPNTFQIKDLRLRCVIYSAKKRQAWNSTGGWPPGLLATRSPPPETCPHPGCPFLDSLQLLWPPKRIWILFSSLFSAPTSSFRALLTSVWNFCNCFLDDLSESRPALYKHILHVSKIQKCPHLWVPYRVPQWWQRGQFPLSGIQDHLQSVLSQTRPSETPPHAPKTVITPQTRDTCPSSEIPYILFPSLPDELRIFQGSGQMHLHCGMFSESPRPQPSSMTFLFFGKHPYHTYFIVLSIFCLSVSLTGSWAPWGQELCCLTHLRLQFHTMGLAHSSYLEIAECSTKQ